VSWLPTTTRSCAAGCLPYSASSPISIARRLISPLREGRGIEPISELTSRELDVLRLVAAGEPNKQIAAELGISERTARTHVSRILRKLHLSSRTQAALWAVGEGLVEVEREPR
jgi:DNA-binding NarL/FixJ family response regulator